MEKSVSTIREGRLIIHGEEEEAADAEGKQGFRIKETVAEHM